MRIIRLQLPRDVIETLLKGKQGMVPFQTDELGFPLRIEIWSGPAREAKPKFGSAAAKPDPEKEPEDDAS